jgi:hypothetical protein
MTRPIGCVLGAVAAAIMAVSAAASAASTARPESLTVSPMVAELRPTPGSPDRVEVHVLNSGTAPERVTITPLDWTSRTDGSLEIEKPGAEASSLTRYISTPVWEFTLRGGERRTVPLDVAIPAQQRAASLWGGVLLKATAQDSPRTALGPATTVLLYADVGQPRRHMRIDALRLVATGNGGGVVMARLRNDGEAYVRAGGRLIVSQAGHVLYDHDVAVGAIFPNRIRLLQQRITGLQRGAPADVTLQADYGADVLLDGETRATP